MIKEWQKRAVRLDRNRGRVEQKRECWGEMQHAHRKMYSLEEGLGKSHIEEGGDRLCKGQGASIEEDIRIEEDSQDQQETLMQWK